MEVILMSTSIDRGTDHSKQAATTPRISRSQDLDSREWLRSLRADGETRNEAVARLHGLLLRAARFEAERRRPGLPPHLSGDELDNIALEAADDALVSVLRRLDDFRGDSRFSTWAYKFAVLETAVKLRKRAWQARELPVDPEGWRLFANVDLAPDAQVEQRELLTCLQTTIVESLTPHQRRVLVALTLNGVPIDVLAERFKTTRGALYKTLHDARQNLRRRLGERGLTIS
jgi:RNA polymerase sigma-70 factor (ECF subfamily)